MRTTLAWALVLACAPVVAISCGGADTAPFGDSSGSGGSSSSSSSSSAAAASGATSASSVAASSGAGGGAGGAGPGATGAGGGPATKCHAAMGDCKSQLQDLRAKLAKAKACDPAGGGAQCQQTIQGPCCPEAVNDANSPEAKCFLETLQEVLTCVGCTDMPCQTPQGDCTTEGDGPAHCI